jgi:sporulation protein YlmC with PRC-barrel domain
MNPKLRKLLLATAIASLLGAPALVTGQASDTPREGWGTQGEERGDARPPAEAGPSAMAPGIAVRDNPLFDQTPEDLEGRDVIGADGDRIGEITEVVMDPERQSVYAVVSSGGLLGIGAREYAVHFNDLQMTGEELQLTTSWDTVEARGRYDEEAYIQFEQKDQPIRDTALLWPGAVDPSYQPGDVDPTEQPGATDRMDQPGAADPTGQPGATDAANPERRGSY